MVKGTPSGEWVRTLLELLNGACFGRVYAARLRSSQWLVAPDENPGLRGVFVEAREERRLDSPRGFLYNGKPLSLSLAEISVATSQCNF